MNKYHSFYLEDVVHIIRKTALEIMLCPSVISVKDTFNESQNARIAVYNEGIRDFSDVLIDVLTSPDQEEEKADDNT